MSAVMPPRRSGYDEEVRRLKKATPYPGDIYYWREFVAQFRNLPETPFAIVLQRVPTHYEIEPPLFSALSKDTFFGIMCERSDGKLGKLCFGRASKEFGGVEHTFPVGIFVVDGFCHSFLHTSTDGFMQPFNHRVVEVHTDRDKVLLKLLEWIKRIASDERYCPRSEPEAANLNRLSKHLGLYLEFCQGSKYSDELGRAHSVVKKQLETWVLGMEKELSDLNERAAFLRHQISLMRE